MTSDPIVITGYARTPIGGLQGVFADLKASELGAAAVKEAVKRAGAPTIDQIAMGCVLAAGQGQAPARQAGLGAGLGENVPAMTLNKMCGSGMQAAILAHDMIAAGSAECVVAGGMESMTNAPYLLAKHRKGARFGHDSVKDSMLLDGLEDAYEAGKPMGAFAEETARAYQIGRGVQDEYALRSLERATCRAAEWRIRTRDRAGPGRQGDHPAGRTARPGQAGENSHPQAGLRARRHHHGRQLRLHFRRRGGAGADARSPWPRRTVQRRLRGSSVMPHMPKRHPCSPPRRCSPCASFWTVSAGARAMWTCSKSTRPSRWWR